MLNDKDRDLLRAALTLEKQRLLRSAREGLAFSMNRERNIGRDSIDESMEEEIFSTELRLRDREKWLLGKIDGALERVTNASIDECEDCGERISFKRLLARPVTTFCIECKERQEMEEDIQATTARPGGMGMGEGGLGEGEAASEE